MFDYNFSVFGQIEKSFKKTFVSNLRKMSQQKTTLRVNSVLIVHVGMKK